MTKALYHYSYSFADAIVPELVARANGKPVPSENAFRVRPSSRPARVLSRMRRSVRRRFSGARESRLLSLGSVFQFAGNGDIVWGTGINPFLQQPLPAGARIDIRSVRGPLSRQFVIDELGLECPERYGDPGILLPRLFPELQRAEEPVHDHLVICQHGDEVYVRKHFERFGRFNMFLCQRPERQPWRVVVREILRSRLVVASSLHALIIAEAFGIPARWWYNDLLPSYYKSGLFKYNDYYLSTHRAPDEYARSIDEALEMGGKAPIEHDLSDDILAAFPTDRV